jgi:beta-lactamase class A
VSSELAAYADTLPQYGSFSLWYGPVDGPPCFELRPAEGHYAASTMKLALVIAAYRQADAGKLDLNNRVRVHDTFQSVVGGLFSMDRGEDSDQQTWRRMGTDVALRWLALRAIVRSGNLATNLLLEAVGLDPVAETLEVIGAGDSVVARGIEDAPARDQGLQNIVTARDLAATLQALVKGSAASRDSCDEVLAMLAAQQINDAIPAGLPPGTNVAHKSGWVKGISHDAGIVYPAGAPPYVLVMCTTSNLSEDDALGLIAGASAAAWRDSTTA